MVNSSMRNTLARRNHKERSQPAHRERLGLLEKHKDYVHRARDYKSKQERIRKLREKAAFRNKDEFYWGMVKGKTKEGVAQGDRGNQALSTDVVKVLKSQDLGYVRLQIKKDEKQIRKLKEELQVAAPVAGPSSEWDAASELAEVEKLAEMGIILRPREVVATSAKGKGKGKMKAPAAGHVIFTEGRDEFTSYETIRPVGSGTPPPPEEEEIDLGWIAPKSSTRSKPKSPSLPAETKTESESEDEAREHRLSLLTELSAFLARIRLLRQAEAKLETTKGLMGKGGARRVRDERWVEDENVPEDKNGERKRFEGKIWKWKLERRK